MGPGTIIANRFEIERVAGVGGMGTVYRAFDRHTGTPVAVKVQLAVASREVDRFAREAEVLSELRHPGLVGYVGHGTLPTGSMWIAMEWLDGEDLAARLARGPLPVEDAVRLVSRVAEALGAAHTRGVVHRDIKPGNVFLVDRALDAPKVLDFGVARRGALPMITGSGVALGTPGYMAPEQARGEHAIDARADVFSLGCLLFECVTGRAAFVGEHVVAVLAKLLLDDAPRLASVATCPLPHGLDALVARMLAKDPNDRPRDANAVVQEIAALGVAEPGPRPAASARPTALGSSEQRLLCVVLLGPPDLGRDVLENARTIGAEIEERIHARLTAAVEPHGARLSPLANGCVVATLFATGSATELAVHAARCAIAMRGVLPDSAVALATGRGDASTPWPVGDVIDRAAALLSADARGAGRARSGGVRVDDVTAALLDGRVDVLREGDVMRLADKVGTVAPVTRVLLARPTTFVGRDRELATLVGLFEECARDSIARVALVVGAPGVGKSRLRHEALTRIRQIAPRAEILVARGDPLSAGSPFGMLSQLILAAIGAREGEPPDTRRARLVARVGQHVPEPDRQRVAEFLAEIIGASFPDESSIQLRSARRDARARGDQMRRAWEDWLTAECAARPLVLVLEDLQWGDRPTIDHVDAVLRLLEQSQLFVLGLARPEVRDAFPGLWDERGLQEIGLGALGRRASETLAREVLDDEGTPEMIARIVERAAGNPFFVEELARSVGEGRGHELPGTVLATVQARLEALDPEARRALRAGSIFGETFWRGAVAVLLGEPARVDEIDSSLEEAMRRELVAKRAVSRYRGDIELTFRHGLVREAAYAMLTESDRVLGHRLAAAWLSERAERDALALAEHFDRGGQAESAMPWYLRAAEQALEGSDLPGAVARAERGIACGATGERRGEFRLLQATALSWSSQLAAAAECAAEALADFAPATSRWYLALSELAVVRSRLGEVASILPMLDQLDPPDGPHEVLIDYLRAATMIGGGLMRYGYSREAYALAAKIDEAAAPISDVDPVTAARVNGLRADFALHEGDYGRSLHYARARLEGFRAGGQIRAECLSRVKMAFSKQQLGAYPEVVEDLQQALVDARRLGLAGVVASAEQNLAIPLAETGKLMDGITFATRSRDAFHEQQDVRMEGASRTYLAELLSRAADLDAALTEAQQAVALLAGSPPLRCLAYATLARVRMRRHDYGPALAAAREARHLIDDPGNVEEGEALARLVLAEALRATGARSEAARAIDEARAALLARAQRITDPFWRTSFLERVHENTRTLALAAAWLGEG